MFKDSDSFDFDAIRSLFRGEQMTGPQIAGIRRILRAAIGLPVSYTAYLLATSFHETDQAMQPIYEAGPRQYFDKYETGTRLGRILGNTEPGDGYRFRGRGDVMLTGRALYTRAGARLDIDLVGNPDQALTPAVSAKILVLGCCEGWFTGKKLGDYLDSVPPRYTQARRVVNGTDRASKIAGYAARFEGALS